VTVLRLGRSRTGLAAQEMLSSHAALATAIKDALPGLIDMSMAPVSGAGDSLPTGTQAAWPARPEFLGARAAFSPAPGKDAAESCGRSDPRRRAWPAR
jgi:hypothetical protein